MATKNILLRLDKIKATTHVVSIKLKADAHNGNIVKLGSYVENDIYYGENPSAGVGLAKDTLVLLAEQFLSYTGLEKEEEQVLKAGTIVRGYILEQGDIITLTEDAINVSETAATTKFVIPTDSNMKMKVATAASENSKLNFAIDALETLKGHKAVVLRVL